METDILCKVDVIAEGPVRAGVGGSHNQQFAGYKSICIKVYRVLP